MQISWVGHGVKSRVVSGAGRMIAPVIVVAGAVAAAGVPTPASIHAPSATACFLTYIPAGPKARIVVPPPPEALRLGLSGDVYVVVSVGPNGAVVDAVASTWSDPLFIEAAVDTARRAQYSPARSNCRPVPGTYAATFAIRVPPKPERVDVRTFFPGTWRCSFGREAWTTTFGGVARDAGAVHEEFIRDADGAWIYRRHGLRAARARPWIDAHWAFVFGESPPQPEFIEYTVTGRDAFERLTLSPGETGMDRCVRSTPP